MPTATVTSKGQITIPVTVRRALGIHAGDRVDFVFHSDDRIEFRPATRSVTELKGFFGPRTEPPLSIEEMDQAVADALAERVR